jgi:hypothetical protein
MNWMHKKGTCNQISKQLKTIKTSIICEESVKTECVCFACNEISFVSFRGAKYNYDSVSTFFFWKITTRVYLRVEEKGAVT